MTYVCVYVCMYVPHQAIRIYIMCLASVSHVTQRGQLDCDISLQIGLLRLIVTTGGRGIFHFKGKVPERRNQTAKRVLFRA